MITQRVIPTKQGVRITVTNHNQHQQNLIHAVLYGDPTAEQVRKALEAYTAFQLDLAGVSELRKHSHQAMRQAMVIWNALSGAKTV